MHFGHWFPSPLVAPTSFLCACCLPALPFAFVIVPWRLISLFVNTIPNLLLSLSTCAYENKIYYVSTVKYTIQKKRPTSTHSKEHVTLAIGIKKLCRAQNVPGLVFALIASPCWQLASMLCGPCIGVRPGICRGAGVGICSHLFSRCPSCWHSHRHASCWCSRRHLLCWCSHGCPSCWCSHGCLSCCRGTGIRLAVAGIHAGICFAVVLAFVQASIVLPFALASVMRAGVMYLSRMVGTHATIRTTVKSIVSN